MGIGEIIAQIQGGKSLLNLQDFVQSKNDIRFAELIVAISRQEQIFTKEELANALWQKVIRFYKQIEDDRHRTILESVKEEIEDKITYYNNFDSEVLALELKEISASVYERQIDSYAHDINSDYKKECFSRFTVLFDYVWESCGYTIDGKIYNKTPLKVVVWKNQRPFRKFFNNNVSFFFLLVLFQLAIKGIQYLFPNVLLLGDDVLFLDDYDFYLTRAYSLFLIIFFSCALFILFFWGKGTKSISIVLSLLFVLCPLAYYVIFSDELIVQYLARLFIARAVCGLLFLPVMFINTTRILAQQTDNDNELKGGGWMIFWFVCSILLADGI